MRSSLLSFSLAGLALALAGCDGADGAPAPPLAGSPAPAIVPVAKQGPDEVVVTNGVADPVPTRVIGTATVAGAVSATQAGAWSVDVQGGTVAASQAGPWSVAAAQAGAWSVDVTSAPPVVLAPGAHVEVDSLPEVTLAGTPSVAIAGTPSVSLVGTPSVAVAGSVTVANDAANPIPVRTVDAGGPTPWTAARRIELVGLFENSELVYTVPAGKRLVIEFIDASTHVLTGHGLAAGVRIAGPSIPTTTQVINYTVKLRDHFGDAGLQLDDAAELVKWYAPAGHTVTLTAVRNAAGGGGPAYAEIVVSGYLVDV